MAAKSMNSGPGYEKHPDHRIILKPSNLHVKVFFAGENIAESQRVITVYEADYVPVHYIPEGDVRMDLLRATDHETYCPFKGQANYWSIKVKGQISENAVWGYRTPYDEVADLKGYIAFYPDRIDDIAIHPIEAG